MPEVPKKEVALKASHDKQDLVELPKFINFACDQGLLGDPDSIRPMSPKVPLPEGEKAALSTSDKTKGIAMETAIEVKVLAETEKEQKPEVLEKKEEVVPQKEPEIKPPPRKASKWAVLRKSLSKVSWLIILYFDVLHLEFLMSPLRSNQDVP